MTPCYNTGVTERDELVKRCFDVAVSGAVLAATAPVMLAVAALVKATSPGPVLYRSRRVGRDGVPFEMLKFRTMYAGTDQQGSFTGKGDHRITPIGSVLRLFKLDEFPQFLNVLRGDMSIVGPRPEAPDLLPGELNEAQRRILSVRPGLTCLVQVRHFPDYSGRVPEGMDAQEFYKTVILPERTEEDLEYVENRSLLLDLKLVLRTAFIIPTKGLLLLFRNPPEEVRRALFGEDGRGGSSRK